MDQCLRCDGMCIEIGDGLLKCLKCGREYRVYEKEWTVEIPLYVH